MHAVALLSRLAEAHDTDVDEQGVAERRVRRRSRGLSTSEQSEVSESPLAGEAGGALEPVTSGRLDEVRVRETIAKKLAASAIQLVPAPAQAAVPLSFDFVRSQDRSQRLVSVGPDVIAIHGIATGALAHSIRGASPVFPARREQRPIAVSVAVEGLLFAVRVDAGDTAEVTAHRLIERLERHFSVELLDAGDEQAILRLTGIRSGAPA